MLLRRELQVSVGCRQIYYTYLVIIYTWDVFKIPNMNGTHVEMSLSILHV